MAKVRSALDRAKRHRTSGGSMTIALPEGKSFFIVKNEGPYRISIVPYVVPEGAQNPYAEPGDLYFERTYWVHRGVGPDNATYVCPALTSKKRCPICEYRRKLARDPRSDEETVSALAPRERQLWNVFDHDNPKEGVQVWDVSYHLFGKQLDARIKGAEPGDGYEYFADPEEGFMLRLMFEEKNLGGATFYQVASIDFRPRKKPLPEKVLEDACVLDELIVVPEYDELAAVLHGEVEEVDSEEADSKDGSYKVKARDVRADQDDEEEDDEWDVWD